MQDTKAAAPPGQPIRYRARQIGGRKGAGGDKARTAGARDYLPWARRWKRVRRNILRCFFLRIRLRRFLMSDPMRRSPYPSRTGHCETSLRRTQQELGGEDSNPYDEDQNLACCQLHHPRLGAPPYRHSHRCQRPAGALAPGLR